MRLPAQLLLLALLLVFPLFASIIKDPLSARPDGADIRLSWTTGSEAGVGRFEIQRRSGHEGEFFFVARKDPQGDNSTYEYLDQQVFKSSGGIYHYRIRIVMTSGATIDTESVPVALVASTAKRTWGSIKAMFR
ncbi:MAG: hypothetical protein WD295_03055 [Bacteroidota bacterium]